MTQHPQSSSELHDLLEDAFASHQRNDLARAEKLYKQLLLHLPDSWQIHFNLGLLYFEQNRLKDACSMYELGIDLAGPNADLLFNYAICLKQAGRLEPALLAYNDALGLEPEQIDIHYNRASCLAALQRFEEAFEAYEEVLKRAPEYLPALNNQAFICHRLGLTDMAIKRYREIIALDPEHASADHMLAALTGSDRRTTSESYIQEIFDEYSTHYDMSLIKQLQYNGPVALLKQAKTLSDDQQFSTMLDLGCGTGLLGEAFRNSVKIMHGIDLSTEMLYVATGKNIYDYLCQASISTYLSGCEPGSYDLIVAGDVFNYIGELTETFSLIKNVITDSGFFLFTVEYLADGPDAMRLNSSGRFAHSSGYIEQTSRLTGWEILSATKLDLRCEADKWVMGLLYSLHKPAEIT